MKKLCVILTVLLIFTFCGCQSQTSSSTDTVTQICLAKAQEYIEAGDYESALAVLEEGVKTSDNPAIAEMLSSVQEMVSKNAASVCPSCSSSNAPDSAFCSSCGTSLDDNSATAETTPAETFDATLYTGDWLAKEVNMSLSLNISAETANIELYYTSDYSQRIASISETFFLSDIENNAVVLPFSDSWLNTGTLVLTFEEGQILCEVKNVTYDTSAMWGFDEGAFTFTKVSTEESSNEENLLLSFGPEERKRINIFLSNFSEHGFERYPAGDETNYIMLQYLCTYANINKPEIIQYDGNTSSFVISRSNADATLMRFFGTTVTPTGSNQTFTNYFGETITFQNGSFYYPAASGESYAYLTIANEMYTNGDGTYQVYYTVYELNPDIYYESGIPDSYYTMTSSEAATDNNLTGCYNGEAVVTDYASGNFLSYQLCSYSHYS